VPASCIALISPYNAQVALLSSLLHTRFPDLEIGSIDGFQGREKDAVIVSLVRSNEEREVGFLRESRRLNGENLLCVGKENYPDATVATVAMTRPKRHLCVVGDSSTVGEGSEFLKKWMSWLEENADVRMAGML
jgi:DNA polymerase alpha-associated DNA helicase A